MSWEHEAMERDIRYLSHQVDELWKAINNLREGKEDRDNDWSYDDFEE
jgi:hypothetical protein